MNYSDYELKAIKRARSIVERKWQGVSETEAFGAPSAAATWCKMHFAAKPNSAVQETFTVIFLNAKHEFILAEDMFTGTIDGAAVYPREVARRCLEVAATAVILSHNHPSGHAEPSAADRRITERLSAGLALFDIRILDHIIVGGNTTYSFAEHGII